MQKGAIYKLHPLGRGVGVWNYAAFKWTIGGGGLMKSVVHIFKL